MFFNVCSYLWQSYNKKIEKTIKVAQISHTVQ